MERVGIAFGCFIPFHAGHQRMIDVALNENDKLLLGVCGKDTDRGQAYIPFKDRQKLIREKFGDDPDITISVVDDDKIGLTGKFDVEAWKTWADEFFINAKANPYDPNIQYTWYTADARYIQVLQQIFPLHRFVQLERNEISGTKIRGETNRYRYMIDPLFAEYLKEKEILK